MKMSATTGVNSGAQQASFDLNIFAILCCVEFLGLIS